MTEVTPAMAPAQSRLRGFCCLGSEGTLNSWWKMGEGGREGGREGGEGGMEGGKAGRDNATFNAK